MRKEADIVICRSRRKRISRILGRLSSLADRSARSEPTLTGLYSACRIRLTDALLPIRATWHEEDRTNSWWRDAANLDRGRRHTTQRVPLAMTLDISTLGQENASTRAASRAASKWGFYNEICTHLADASSKQTICLVSQFTELNSDTDCQ